MWLGVCPDQNAQDRTWDLLCDLWRSLDLAGPWLVFPPVNKEGAGDMFFHGLSSPGT